jgi:hypothetical protein
MMIPNMPAADVSLSPPTCIRRPDLSPSIRMQIACAAVVARLSGHWGVMTE